MSNTRRKLVNRCVREAILFSLVGDFPKKDIPAYKRDMKACTAADLAFEVRMSAYNDYPKAQEYLQKGGIRERYRALRAIKGTESNPALN